MKPTYFLGIDVAKQKIRAALLSATESRTCFERDLPVSAAGRRKLLTLLRQHVSEPNQLLVLIEATGILHLHWAASLTKAGYSVLVLNPLMARRLCTVKNSILDNKTDPIDARGLCTLGLLQGEALEEKYRFAPDPSQLTLQRLHSVRQAVRNALTNLKKTYLNLLEVSFPELGQLLQPDGVGIRAVLLAAPTPAAIARKRLSSLQQHWMLRPKAAQLKTLAADSIADPDLASASAPALCGILRTMAELEQRLARLDQQIQTLARQAAPTRHALLQTIPGFGPTTAAKVIAYLPEQLLQSGNHRTAATRLQAYMGNDPRLQESGQYKGQVKMTKRGVEPLRTAFFQAAFTASQHDPELKVFYQRKRAENKEHKVALSHTMRILTRRLVAVLRSQQPYTPKEAAPLSYAA